MEYLNLNPTTKLQKSAIEVINKIIDKLGRMRISHGELPNEDIAKLIKNVLGFAIDRAYPGNLSALPGLSAADLGYKPSISVDGKAEIPFPLVALTSKKTQSEVIRIIIAIDPCLRKSMRADSYLFFNNYLSAMVHATPKDLEEALGSIGALDFVKVGPTH